MLWESTTSTCSLLFYHQKWIPPCLTKVSWHNYHINFCDMVMMLCTLHCYINLCVDKQHVKYKYLQGKMGCNEKMCFIHNMGSNLLWKFPSSSVFTISSYISLPYLHTFFQVAWLDRWHEQVRLKGLLLDRQIVLYPPDQIIFTLLITNHF